MNSFINMTSDYLKELIQEGYPEDAIVELKVSSYTFERMVLENGNDPKNRYNVEIYTQMGKIKVRRDVTPLIEERENKIKDLQDEILDLEVYK